MGLRNGELIRCLSHIKDPITRAARPIRGSTRRGQALCWQSQAHGSSHYHNVMEILFCFWPPGARAGLRSRPALTEHQQLRQGVLLPTMGQINVACTSLSPDLSRIDKVGW